MAKQLYDYWFVQFDFPDENGRPYKSSGGKMVWNEKLKRDIPEGWKDIALSTFLGKNKSGDWGDSLFVVMPISKVEDLLPFGMNGTEQRFSVKELTSKHLVLQSNYARLEFRKF